MAPLLFPTFDLSENEVALITEIYQTLKPSYPEAAFDFDFQPPLSDFEAIRGNYVDIRLGPVLRMDETIPGKYLCFAHLTCRLSGGKYSSASYTDHQTWAVSFLQRKYGHVLIRPESTLDKIRELLHHVKIDFEDDKEFNSHFYVLANEEDKARMLLGPSLRQTIAELHLKDFVIEVIDNVMIVGDNKSVDPTTACEMASFLYKLSRFV